MISVAFVWGEVTILGNSLLLAGESTPRKMADHMGDAEEKILSSAQHRFATYGSSAARRGSTRQSYIRTALGFQGASGVLKSGIGSYTTIGQTLPRSRSRPRPQYTELQLRKAIIPARDASMLMAKRSAVLGISDALRTNGL